MHCDDDLYDVHTDLADEQPLAAHRLPRGEMAHLRLLRPGERSLVVDVFESMSADSRFLRFHSAMPRLSEGAVRYLAAVEPGQHVAVVAIIGGRAVGLARWIRLRKDPTTAELAVAVGDDYHGNGLGHALVATAAAEAQRAGIRMFACAVHAENRTVRMVLHALGVRAGVEPDEFVLPVAAALRLVSPVQDGAPVVPWPRGVRRAGAVEGNPRRS